MADSSIVAAFKPRYGRHLLASLPGFIWVAGSISMYVRFGKLGDGRLDALFIALPLLAFGVSVYCLARVIRRQPAIVIRADGFEERAAVFPMGFVPWSEVRELLLYIVGKHRFLCVHLFDERALVAVLPFPIRWVKRLQSLYGWPPVSIPQAGVQEHVESICEQMSNALFAATGRRPKTIRVPSP